MPPKIIERDAVICGNYRYLLRRVWDHDRPRALFVMLNPSTADAQIDDATIRSCCRLCVDWSYGSFEVVNLFGWRATDPAELASVADPIGPDNDLIVVMAIHRCHTVICAWGANPFAVGRDHEMAALIKRHRPETYCLGMTQVGAPKHPLYIKTGTKLLAYPMARRAGA